MSAGTGIQHSEFNRNPDKPVHFLQIWIFPNKKGVSPRYDQLTLDPEKMKNKLAQILSPNPEDEGVWIHQDCWFHRGKFESGQNTAYTLKKQGNGLYIFLLEGKAEIAGQELKRRDGLGITQADLVEFHFSESSDILLMEVPMTLNR
jgi:redox-sensitive bicupin YhaK (pirin superfamily)